jgi:hypothetical protein
MFTRGMLRPSRRHAHERISQSEDANNDAGDNNNDNIAEDERSEEPSFDAIGGGDGGATVAIIGDGSQSQHHHHDHDLNLTEGGTGGTDAPSRPTSSSVGNHDMINSSNPRDTTNNASSSSNNAENDEPNLEPVSSEENDDDDDNRELEGALQPNPTTHPFLTSQIQTERELRARRQSTCTLLILFFLVRLWFEAVLEKDVGLIFLSTMGTVWTYRWFATRREAEEEYDRQIVAEERNNDAGGGVASGAENNGAGSGADAAVDFDPDLGLMSFQAQLALAILESQRQMFENGGYGGNDRASNDEPGVTNEAKERWKSYEWGECVEETAKLAGMSRSSSTEAIKRTGSGGDYGSVGTVVDLNEDEGLDKSSVEGLEGGLLASFDDDEEPSCSICLCEYERGEKVIGLPCGHLYHESCLDSWTESHVRCPLCNLDLMEGFEQPANVQRAQAHAEEQRAFRHMALSTLGRRIRTRRAASRRRSERATAAASMMAAAEDSIV